MTSDVPPSLLISRRAAPPAAATASSALAAATTSFCSDSASDIISRVMLYDYIFSPLA